MSQKRTLDADNQSGRGTGTGGSWGGFRSVSLTTPSATQFAHFQDVSTGAMSDPNTAARRWGVTDPISTAGPTARDLELTSKLEALLRAMNQFEPPQESQEREEALGQLNLIIKEWVHKASLKKVRKNAHTRCFLFFAAFSSCRHLHPLYSQKRTDITNKLPSSTCLIFVNRV